MTESKIQGIEISASEFENTGSRVKSLRDIHALLQELSEQDTSRLLSGLLSCGVLLRASDLHIEPEESEVVLRLRLDGILHEAGRLSPAVYAPLLSRIKLKAGIKLNIENKPQDGRITFSAGDREIEIRVSTLPATHGEALVLRFLDPSSLSSLKDLGLRPDLFELFSKEISRPHGMVIVTGPTGSGKTTTLYAFLQEVRKPELKIITIEDPVEYRLEGVSQTQVHPEKGYDFASGLRSIVRQDPDVILVGEIRDGETAGIALQAALTGHLVFSTLHTNDAAGAAPRLESLGASPSNIAAAVNIIIAQRLVRKVCQACVKLESDPGKERKILDALKQLPAALQRDIPKSLRVPIAQGCQDCNFTGYKGRTGIYEAIPISASVEKAIRASAPASELETGAVSQGMVRMYQDGLLKVVVHITTLEEVERVVEAP
ncbi:MAG: ATPase, T2SS/T4P/T4SS family [Candidatus Yanofskybacteria bacterium]|nr:ATPase, T2SS/T4P/T4SS family [Candidatus Yanofskybacteria bacterium]